MLFCFIGKWLYNTKGPKEAPIYLCISVYWVYVVAKKVEMNHFCYSVEHFWYSRFVTLGTKVSKMDAEYQLWYYLHSAFDCRQFQLWCWLVYLWY